MKSLVTGGGGFLGKHMVRLLVERGDEVTVLGRHIYPEVREMGAQSIACDIRDQVAVMGHVKGVDEVYHAAAIADIWGKWETFYAINVVGTQNMLSACREHGISKFVYTSSPSVVFGAAPQKGVNEDEPYPTSYLADYPKTKMLAEKLVLAADGENLHTVSLRPHLIWGPGDHHLIPRVIERAKKGQLAQVGDGQNLVDIIYVENAARAHLQAAAQLGPGAACNGKAYFLSQNEPVKLWSFISQVLDRAQVPQVKKHLSFKLAYGIGAAMEASYRLLNKTSEPRMTRFLACQLAMDHYYDTSRAQQDFGYGPEVSTEEGLNRLFS